jgi:parvulin-like peptidyl-prolyl isomerase
MQLRSFIQRTALVGFLVALLARPGGSQERPKGVTPLPPHLVRMVTNPTEQVAFVGDQAILAGDLLPSVDQALQKYVGTVSDDDMQQQRALFVQQMLPRKIEVELVLLDFWRSIPADKQKEVLANIEKQVEKQYYEEQVPDAMKALEVDCLADLETKLRRFGTSIEAQKSDFRKQMLVRSMVQQKIERQPEITYGELRKYYDEHSKDYSVPARARWEQLTVRFDKFPDRVAADQAIVEMGNQVLRGAEFAAVAKKLSQGTSASEGGYHDWTTQGSLVSDVLDQAIFSLPLHQMSLKLEDQTGYHIIRVLEREDAHRIEFPQAQDGIREKIREERRKQQIREYIEKLHKDTYVWTIFDQLEPSK